MNQKEDLQGRDVENGEQVVSLYAASRKIHPRSVSGWFSNWRWALVWITQIVFYGLCWMDWNGRQAVLFDLAQRKFYIFGLVLWPQDIIYLAVLLIISAFALFLFTAVAGRLWCGYACPQTVYTEIFLWIEEKIEGDRNARMKLDRQAMNVAKFGKRFAKHGLWLLFALWTGITFVGYFTPIKELLGEIARADLGPWELFWIFLYGLATYGNAGFLREQVCLYMCPYARFQGVMFDPDTLIITYDAERGEPRGARSKKLDHRAAGKGDCVDCGICVQVCPTGIDIRGGLQYECIGCAACIDACDQVMDRMGYERGLIRYSTENAMREHFGKTGILAHIVRPRVLLYAAILGLVVAATLWSLVARLPLKVDVIRDRNVLAREVEGGMIENVFRLQIMNIEERARRYAIDASGLDGIDVVTERIVEVPAATTQTVLLRLHASPDVGKRGANQIEIEVKSLADEKTRVVEKASFIQP